MPVLCKLLPRYWNYNLWGIAAIRKPLVVELLSLIWCCFTCRKPLCLLATARQLDGQLQLRLIMQMIFLHMSVRCMLVPVQCDNGLFIWGSMHPVSHYPVLIFSCLHLNMFNFFRCQQSSAELESCSEKLHDVTEVAKKVKVSYPPEAPITLDWMKNKLEVVGQEMQSIKTRKSQAAQAIMNNRVSG